ncbi:MAG: dihydrolipoyl dehydrogenase [Abditibacteriales bacterium]|nr:dihydrolipoyl dehydrogenase [Abditibacteriales bacterium]MDW8366200.1 dihydrolipoyl dehydrogenase [Abditibacteriales bacterium]
MNMPKDAHNAVEAPTKTREAVGVESELAEEADAVQEKPQPVEAPKSRAFDVVVIGGGPGGYAAAVRVAELGGRVLLVEKDDLGGAHVNRGGVSSKALLDSVNLLRWLENAEDFGVEVRHIRPLFDRMMRRQARLVRQWRAAWELFAGDHHVQVARGRARLVEPHVVEVELRDGKVERFKALSVIVATGSSPAPPPVPGGDGAGVLTSDNVWEMEELPSSLVVLGGGYVGVEFAYLFAQLGAQVALVEVLPRILATEDKDISKEMTRLLEESGVRLCLNAKVVGIADYEKQKVVFFEGLNGPGEVVAAKVLAVAGRKPNIAHLGLEAVGVRIEAGRIMADDHLRTSVKGIYAVGDVLRGDGWAHLAAAEGIVAGENAMGGDRRIEREGVPRCLYTSPEIASVGLTELQAQEQGRAIRTGLARFRFNERALIAGEREGFVKVIVSEPTEQVIGVHIIGARAVDLVAAGVLTLKAGLTVNELLATIHAHPSFVETFFEAVKATRHAHGL